MKVNDTRREEVHVHKEFAPVGKYRVRLLVDAEATKKTLDIREYVSSQTFEGFTRRGIRLSERAQVEQLRDAISELLEDSSF